MRVRQSDLKLFGDCAMQYYYSRILGLQAEKVGSLTVLGSVWHFAMEVYETYGGNLDLAIRTFDYYWDNPTELGLRLDFYHPRTTHEGLRDRGHHMLEQYHDLVPWKTGTHLGSEIHFVVPLGDHELEGTIDKLWARRGRVNTIEIIDFKTAAKVPERLQFNLQFTAYAYATTRPEFWQFVPGHEDDGYAKYASFKRQGWWWHARNSKKYNAGYRSDHDYNRLLLAVNQMDRAIKSEVFPLTIEGSACAYCPFEEKECGSEVVLDGG